MKRYETRIILLLRTDVYKLNKMMTKDTLSVILLAFAAGLFISSITTGWAQQGVNVTTPAGETEEVPTLTEAIQANLQSLIALITAVIALIGLVIKSGILDPWLDRKKQDQFYTSRTARTCHNEKGIGR